MSFTTTQKNRIVFAIANSRIIASRIFGLVILLLILFTGGETEALLRLSIVNGIQHFLEFQYPKALSLSIVETAGF